MRWLAIALGCVAVVIVVAWMLVGYLIAVVALTRITSSKCGLRQAHSSNGHNSPVDGENLYYRHGDGIAA